MRITLFIDEASEWRSIVEQLLSQCGHYLEIIEWDNAKQIYLGDRMNLYCEYLNYKLTIETKSEGVM